MSARSCLVIFLFYFEAAFICINGQQIYTAAVYEHNPFLNLDPHTIIDRQSALKLMKKNLDIYEEQVKIASKQGVQIIVFPEDGLHGFKYTRESIYPFLEPVPDPTKVKWNPCLQPSLHSGNEVLKRLSCIARNGNMYVVANMPTKQDCNKTDPKCPADGRYQYNTNVAFSDNGTLVARYHKQNLYKEMEFNTPPEVEHVIFETPFAGKFGMFICFDLLFYEPAVSLIEKYNVSQIVFPTAWMNASPFLSGVQFQRGFASAFSINLLAANLHIPQQRMTSSGLYTPDDSFYYYDVESQEGKLTVAEIPVNPVSHNKSVDACKTSDHSQFTPCKKLSRCNAKRSVDISQVVFPMIKEDRNNPPTFHSIIHHDNFALIPLKKPAGELEVCSQSLCCHVSYHGKFSENELYALGAYDGFHKSNTYYIQVCTLLKCANASFASCGAHTTIAHSTIDFVIWGNHSTQHVFPEILGSDVIPFLPDGMGWKNKIYTMCKSDMSSGLLSANLYGRWYEKDNSL
ncbi:biotinidase-like isoform X2 [Protopterus annectens]|nr:biotinidase-like isoform X2 [Protopterus annectens]XP_043922772.1 biotinidase-like isoform X2 [Protopterus annectens]XP_043922773.1 biotinidase-like isoform X2 [Protopterus annectens]